MVHYARYRLDPLREVMRALSEIQASTRREQEAVKHIVATIFSAQNALRDLAPHQKWAGMGKSSRDYGEFVALSNYNLKKGPAGADGYDAITNDGLKVQSESFIILYGFSRRSRSSLGVED